MRKSLVALAAAGLLASGMLTACDDGADPGDNGDNGAATTPGKTSGKGGIGVILPDTKSSQRWSTDDPRYLQAAFDAAKVPAQIVNAEGDKENFKRLAEGLLDDGVKVLVIANLDSGSGKAVIDNAKARGVSVIDYDRMTLNGGADYYVSFDNEQVGKLQASHLKSCLKAKKKSGTPVVAELNGSLTDNNATLFKNGYDSVLQPMYDTAQYIKGPDQFVPDWDNDEGREIFAQMLKQFPNIDGVLAANDGLGNAVIEVLKEKKLNGRVPVTGQDATVEGLQNILAGDQCMTVYKSIKKEADAAASLAIELYKGNKPVVGTKIKDPESGAYVPFLSQEPVAITVKNIKTVLNDGFVTKQALCTKEYQQLCRQAGIK
jgi:D-xylose transport system substrate-binding protein